MDSVTIGTKIRDRRKELGMTADQLAEAVGMNRASIYHYEAGDFKNVRLPAVTSIAEALGVSVEWLTGRTDDPTPEADAYLLKPEDRTDVFHILQAAEQLMRQDGLTMDGRPAPAEIVEGIRDGLDYTIETARIRRRRISNG